MSTATLEAARRYVARGWRVVPIPPREKGPKLSGWTTLRLENGALDRHFTEPANVGILLGEPSGWLVDVDLDCPEAVELADELLPPTGAVTGREGRPRSHRWYIVRGAESRRAKDPISGEVIAEIRSTGGQTVVGPSEHPEGGLYDELAGEPAEVELEVLEAAFDELVASVIQVRHPARAPSPEPAPAPSSRPDNLERAIRYLEAMPPAISGQGGHSSTYAAATALVHGFELDTETAFALLVDRYNPRCDPPWSERELRHKVTQAATKPHDRPRGWLLHAERERFAGGPEADLSGILATIGSTQEQREAAKWAPPEDDDAGFLTPEELEPEPISPPLIDGLLRYGEIANFIAAPKTGKSWLSLDLAITASVGGDWLGRFPIEAGSVVLIDNELKPGTLNHRLGMALGARNVSRAEVRSIKIKALRGGLRNLYRVFGLLEKLEPNERRLVILDAWYRFLPAGKDENSNSDITELYNLLDYQANRLGCAFVLIHHTSKGNQGAKGVTDVGAGAGAQSRAADTHIVIREHQEPGHVVVDAAVRSFRPVSPFVLRREFPRFEPADGEDAGKVKGTGSSGPSVTLEEFVARFVPGRISTREIEARAVASGLSPTAAGNMRREAQRAGLICEVTTAKRGPGGSPALWAPAGHSIMLEAQERAEAAAEARSLDAQSASIEAGGRTPTGNGPREHSYGRG